MQPMFYPDWQEKVVFGDQGPRPEVLAMNDQMKVVIAGLKPGQKIPPHPEAMAAYHFLQGSGWMIVDDDRYQVSAGATIIVNEGSVRGIEADTELAFLAIRVTGK